MTTPQLQMSCEDHISLRNLKNIKRSLLCSLEHTVIHSLKEHSCMTNIYPFYTTLPFIV